MAIQKQVLKIPLSDWGKGTITHDDVEKTQVKFRVLHWGDTHVFVEAYGEDANLSSWSKRVSATKSTKTEADTTKTAETPATSKCDMGYEHPTSNTRADDIKPIEIKR